MRKKNLNVEKLAIFIATSMRKVYAAMPKVAASFFFHSHYENVELRVKSGRVKIICWLTAFFYRSRNFNLRKINPVNFEEILKLLSVTKISHAMSIASIGDNGKLIMWIKSHWTSYEHFSCLSCYTQLFIYMEIHLIENVGNKSFINKCSSSFCGRFFLLFSFLCSCARLLRKEKKYLWREMISKVHISMIMTELFSSSFTRTVTSANWFNYMQSEAGRVNFNAHQQQTTALNWYKLHIMWVSRVNTNLMI